MKSSEMSRGNGRPTSKRRQPQRLPPPIMHGDWVLDAEIVLTEFGEELGLLLWKTVRSVRLWGELPEGERSRAFASDAYENRIERLGTAALPADLREPLEKLADVLHPRARVTTVATACRAIADWAVQQGKLGTAIEFLQAAAVVMPDDAALAHDVARLARTRAEYTRAETWYRQAIARARRTRRWYDFARSYIGIGNVFRARGSFPQARKSLIRGLRAAKRFSHQPLIAAGYHELTVLAIKADHPAEATRYAQAAVGAYGQGHPRLPALAFDYGAFLLSSGYYAEALRVFRSVPATFGRPTDQLARAAAMVQAAGATRNELAYRNAWLDAEQLIARPETASIAATAMIAMARGAQAVEEFNVAEELVLQAQRKAGEYGEAALEFEAAELLTSIRTAAAAVEKAAIAMPAVASATIVDVVEELELVLGAAVPV